MYTQEEQQQIIDDMSASIYNKERTYTEDELGKDAVWIEASKAVYKKLRGTDYVGTDEELAKEGFNIMSEFNHDMTFGTVGQTLTMDDADDYTKTAFYYMIDTYDKKDISMNGVKRALWQMGSDPLNHAMVIGTAGIGFFGKAAAASAAKAGVKETLKQAAMRYMTNPVAVGAVEGAAYTVIDDAAWQDAKIGAGYQEAYDPVQGAVAGAVGAGVGGGLVKATDVAVKGIGKGINKVIESGEEEMMKAAGGGTPPVIEHNEVVSKFQKDVNIQAEKHGDINNLDYNMMDISDRDLTRIQRVKNTIEEIQGDPENAVYTTSTFNEFEEYYPDQFKYAKIKPEVKGGKVKIYRSATGDIEPGDWIGLDPKYAQSHSRTKDHKLYEMWVDKDDIRWQGADANEWIYLPKDIVNSEIDFKGAKQ